MKQILALFKAVCSIAAALQLYTTIDQTVKGSETILLSVLSSVFAIAITVFSFVIASLFERVKIIEDVAGIYVDRGYEEDTPKKECPSCREMIDASFKICPHCENRSFDNEYFHDFSKSEYFNTDDPDYNGTDFSYDDVVSANTDNTEI